MNEIWHLLIDADFVDAYVHGMLIECGDGVTRRVFPRILTYSADYPEKYMHSVCTTGPCADVLTTM